jgi:hypothetical protein
MTMIQSDHLAPLLLRQRNHTGAEQPTGSRDENHGNSAQPTMQGSLRLWQIDEDDIKDEAAIISR